MPSRPRQGRRNRFRKHSEDVPADEITVIVEDDPDIQDPSDPSNYDPDGDGLNDHLVAIDEELGLQSSITESLAESIALRLQQIEWHLQRITGLDSPEFDGATAQLDTIIFYLEHITGEEAPS